MELENLVAVYPALPFVRTTLQKNEAGRAENTQWECECTDLEALRTSWHNVAESQPVVRGFFAWRTVKRPMHLFARSIPCEIPCSDWRDKTEEEQDRAWAELICAEKDHRYSRSEAPLIRAKAAQIANGRYRVVWTADALLLDAESMDRLGGLILSGAAGDALDYVTPFEHVWIENHEATRRWWERISNPCLMGAGEDAPTHVERFGSALMDVSEARIAVAWGLIVAAYTGQTEVVFGFRINGRPPGADYAGCFRQVLPMKFEHSPGATASAWIEDFEQQRNEMQQLAGCCIEPPPLAAQFDSVISILPPGTRSSEGLDYALSCTAVPSAHGLRVEVASRSTAISEAMLRQIVSSFRYVLEHLAPDAVLDESPALPPGLRDALLYEWNRATMRDLQAANVVEWFERQAAIQPEAAAVRFEERTLTYRELNAWSNRVARKLQSMGAGTDVPVGLFFDRSLEMLPAILGVLKSGAAYIPLDPSYPADRLTYLIEDSQPPILVTISRLLNLLPSSWAQVLLLDEEMGVDSGDENRRAGITAEQLAYIIYTSGSTGAPKASMISHGNLVHSTNARFSYYGGAPKSYLLVSSYAFDSSVAGIYWTLCGGGTLVLPRDEEQRDPFALAGLIARHRISHVVALPSVYQSLLELAGPGELNSLEVAIVAGEECHGPIVERHHMMLPATRLYNEYGPTEGTVWSSVFACVASAVTGSVPIGKPMGNVDVFLLDPALQPVPPGVRGEIWIGGAGVARGYRNWPEGTAERFGPDPFSSRPGGRLYRTGDLGRLNPDGNVEFHGRADHQVKVRGHRVEPGEIECAIAQFPHVKEAIVVARRDVHGNTELTGYLTAHRGEELDDAGPVASFRELYDDLYTDEGAYSQIDPSINLRVWKSSYTRAGLPEEEIAECLDDSITRILRLSPRRVLEIGCGTGLLLRRIVPHCEFYCGVDISPAALARVRSTIPAEWLRDRLHLEQLAAHEISRCAHLGPFDLVILNEVVQHFSNVSYLSGVLEQAVELCPGGGAVFVGGVRSLPLLDAFYASVYRFSNRETSHVELRQRIEEQRNSEKDLILDPAFFDAIPSSIPRITEVAIEVKGGAAWNEITRFQYDATLFVEAARGPIECQWIEAKASIGVDEIARTLRRDQPSALGWSGLPNQRVIEDCYAAEGSKNPPQGVSPAAIWELAGSLGYQAEIHPSQRPEAFDVLFRRAPAPLPPASNSSFPGSRSRAGQALAEYSNRGLVRPSPEWLPQLMAHLREKLPDYMVPARIVVLEEFPRTPNGKVDRRKLPEPVLPAVLAPAESDRTQTPAQEIIAGIWCEVLGLERIGIGENFFDVGGHSLLATQVIARMRMAFGREFPVQLIFDTPTIAGLANSIEGARQDARIELRPMAGREVPAPLSFAQERLWFLSRLTPGQTAYHVSTLLRIEGPLDLNRLQCALEGIVRRHETLRTTFLDKDGRPFQTIRPPAPLHLEVCSVDEMPDALSVAAAEENAPPFDLTSGPLFRVKVFQEAPERHILCFTAHHIVADAWSVSILVRELSQLYRDADAPLPDLPVQYVDYALWQRAWLTDQILDEHMAFWHRALEGIEPLPLPLDFERPATSSGPAGSVGIMLDSGVASDLRRFCRQHGATPFMVFLAAFSLVLSKYSATEDVVVGTPIGSRDHPDLDPLIGFFVNTLPIRVDLSGQPSFLELVQRTRTASLEAYAHRDLPFERLVEQLPIERDLRRTPVFQVMLNLQNTPSGTLDLPGLTLTPLPVDIAEAKFELLMSLGETPSGFAGRLTYRKDLFAHTTIVHMAQIWQRLLEGALAAPERRVSEIELLEPGERRQVLEDWNRTHSEVGFEAVHIRIAAQAAETPHAIAATCEGSQVTFRDLAQRARSLAAHLQAMGVGRECRVAICVERSVEMLVALLAVWSAGGVHVPIDPEYPAERIAFILRGATVTAVLTQSRLQKRFDSLSARIVSVDEALPVGELRAVPIDSQQLAYIIYTSGSTGVPKGVAVSHGALANHIEWRRARFPLRYSDAVLHKASPSFDISLLELVWPLTQGARVCMAEPGKQADPAYLASLIESGRISVAHFGPAALRSFLDHPLAMRCGCLRYVFCGGELLTTELAADFASQLPATTLVHQYGPTEAAIDATATLNPCSGRRPIPIGRPILNTEAYVLDAGMQPVPVGIPGELYLAGKGLARGYWNQPALTAERFLPNPFGQAGDRLYRTGDRVNWNREGELEFLGRFDTQVKLRGYRIELGEIETVLCAHPAVREAAVVMRDQMLAAYVAADRQEDWRDYLSRKLPVYMVPAVVVELERLPRTLNGKLDRRQLPEPRRLTTTDVEAPLGGVEEVIALIWSELLSAEPIGRHDNFFHLGGHSLMATRLVSRLRQTLGVELPLRAVFENPEIAALASAVEGLQSGGAARAIARRQNPADAAPLSYAQQRLWFLAQLEPGSVAYNIPAVIRMRGNLNVRALEQALQALVRRHETLRTRFVARDGEPQQIIAAELPVHLPVVNAPENEALEIARKQSLEAFDLETGPLLRMQLVRIASDHHLLVLTLHHIISDGWSTGVLIAEVGALYAAYASGRDPHLPELPIQYADYAVWQRQFLQGGELERQLSYWRNRLEGAPVLELMGDHARPAVWSERGAMERLELGAELSGAVERFSRERQATVFMTVLGGLAATLARYTGQAEVVIGTPIANRTRAELEGLIGFLVNTLALRVEVKREEGFGALVDRVREEALQGYAHQDVPFEKVVEELSPERDRSRTPLFQVLFTHQTAPRHKLGLTGVEVDAVEMPAITTHFDLEVHAVTTSTGLSLVASYSTSLFTAPTIRNLLCNLQQLLAVGTASPGRPVASLPIAAAEERLALEQCGSVSGPPVEECVHLRVERQAESTPDAVAVEFAGETLTYRELNARANRLARYLRSRGAYTDCIVAISIERSIAMAVAVLAVLKAGAGYLPLDPAYPKDRLQAMKEDANPVLVLDDLNIHAIEAESRTWDAANPAFSVSPDNIAYVMYTSGSTGRPKGIALPHRSLTNLIEWHTGTLRSPARTMQFASLSFDASFHEMFAAWWTGGTLVLIAEALRTEITELAAFLVSSRIEKAILPVVVLHHLAEHALATGLFPPLLRHVMATGEQLQITSAMREFFERLPSCTLHNHYGPSETHVVTALTLSGEPRQWEVNPTIGGPISNTRVYIADRDLQLVPAMVPGELYLAGVSLARGYLDKPDLTAERFLPDPFSSIPGERMYRTGDLTRWRHDGTIEFLGRLDHQVKIRGFRVELGEIEAVLNQHPAVRQSLVMTAAEKSGAKKLIAYAVVEADAPPASSLALKSHLREKLPDYMVPASIVLLERFPLNKNGKIDRASLPKPDAPAVTEAYVPPRDAVELKLVNILEELLGVSPIGVRDDFFELGGHSLLAVRFVARVRGEFSIELPVAALFEETTVEKLRQRLTRTCVLAPQKSLVPIRPADQGQPVFFVHPAGGNALCYVPLARHLGDSHAVYGLQAPGLDGRSPILTSVEQMAERYLAEIQEVRPHGPYTLAAWSMGGCIAYEMARQLTAAGEEVSSLILLDSSPPDPSLKGIDDGALLQMAAAEFGLAPGEAVHTIAELLNRLREENLISADLSQGAFFVDVYRAIWRAVSSYEMRPWNATIALIRPEGKAPGPDDDFSNGWNRWTAAPVSLLPVACTHRQMVMEPHVAAVAAQVRLVLERASTLRSTAG